MIDTLVRLLPAVDPAQSFERLGLTNGAGPRPYVLVTLHRPSNVDEHVTLSRLLDTLAEIGRDVPVVFPVHRRTKARISEIGIPARNIAVTEPLTYLECLGLQRHAALSSPTRAASRKRPRSLACPV